MYDQEADQERPVVIYQTALAEWKLFPAEENTFLVYVHELLKVGSENSRIIVSM